MRPTTALLAFLAGTAFVACPARAQIPQGLLQQLLPNQGQNQPGAEQAVREAYERGYRQGRQDQERADTDRSRGQGPGSYPNQGGGNYPRNQYNR